MTMNSEACLLTATGIDVRRGRQFVLSDVSLRVRGGDTLQISGQNGSGKTSLLRVLSGVAAPRAGVLRRHADCAFVPERVLLAPALRCKEWFEAMRRIRGGDPVDWATAIQDSGLQPDVLNSTTGSMSKGMLQRVALIEALLSNCSLLLFDEPFSGLDDDGRDWLAGAIRDRTGRGAGAVITDHSGAAQGRITPTCVVNLADGTAGLGQATERERTPRALVVVRARDQGGQILRREVPEPEVDDLLRELLAGGWHIEAVRG